MCEPYDTTGNAKHRKGGDQTTAVERRRRGRLTGKCVGHGVAGIDRTAGAEVVVDELHKAVAAAATYSPANISRLHLALYRRILPG